MSKEDTKLYCGGMWTEARRNTFIKGLLRGGGRKWGPKGTALKESRLRRGFYHCAGCEQAVPATLPPKPGNKRRIKNALVDHIHPVVDPCIGFTTWDETIERMFCEIDNLQVLCHDCHQIKTNLEKAIAAYRRRLEKKDVPT